jgi:uncharacterized BrkB/YihY/UPF0761 family membrane protein
MDIKFLLVAIIFLGFAVMAIASNSIAIKCANDNATWKEGQKVNFQFLTSQLVSAILMVLCAFMAIYWAVKGGNRVQLAVKNTATVQQELAVKAVANAKALAAKAAANAKALANAAT